jgi:Resolvase, N terminal domain
MRQSFQREGKRRARRKCFLDMLGLFAEFETNLRRERQLEGVAKAKAAGVYKGRPPSNAIERLHDSSGCTTALRRIPTKCRIARAFVCLSRVPPVKMRRGLLERTRSKCKNSRSRGHANGQLRG